MSVLQGRPTLALDGMNGAANAHFSFVASLAYGWERRSYLGSVLTVQGINVSSSRSSRDAQIAEIIQLKFRVDSEEMAAGRFAVFL